MRRFLVAVKSLLSNGRPKHLETFFDNLECPDCGNRTYYSSQDGSHDSVEECTNCHSRFGIQGPPFNMIERLPKRTADGGQHLSLIEDPKMTEPPVIDSRLDIGQALETAIRHIEHMSKWIADRSRDPTKLSAYSLGKINEDMPGLKAALHHHANANTATKREDAITSTQPIFPKNHRVGQQFDISNNEPEEIHDTDDIYIGPNAEQLLEAKAKTLYEFVNSKGIHGPNAKPWTERSERHKQLWRDAYSATSGTVEETQSDGDTHAINGPFASPARFIDDSDAVPTHPGSLFTKSDNGAVIDTNKTVFEAKHRGNTFSRFVRDQLQAADPEVEDKALFQQRSFISAAGLSLSWKIECEALSETDWRTIAAVAVGSLPKFKKAIGVPRGGLKLAEAFGAFATHEADLVLVVDDVWTTGRSLTHFAADHGGPDWFGFVAFARGPLPSNVCCFAQCGPQAITDAKRDN